MIPITQKEKFVIEKRFPKSPIVRLMKKDSKRKHYNCTADKCVLEYLSETRKVPIQDLDKI
jgi:hypothetical protein